MSETSPLVGELTRKPKGYVGLNHMTRGGDIVSILKVLHSPELTLGEENYRRLSLMSATSWYPIATLLEMLELLGKKLGAPGLKSVGWNIFATFHSEEARKHFDNVHDLLHALDAMYHAGNKGHRIGNWTVTDFRPGYALLEKTTPHHCAMEEGIVEEAVRTMGVKATVDQLECFRNGAPCCIFRVQSPVTDQRWSKVPPK